MRARRKVETRINQACLAFLWTKKAAQLTKHYERKRLTRDFSAFDHLPGEAIRRRLPVAARVHAAEGSPRLGFCAPACSALHGSRRDDARDLSLVQRFIVVARCP